MRRVCVLSAMLLLAACKKEKPAPAPPPAPAPVTYQVSAKINGELFRCNSCISAYRSGDLGGVNVHIPNSQDRLLFSFSGVPAPGVYQLRRGSWPGFVYEKSNTYYRAVNGAMTITAIDSSTSGTINRLACTFECMTDTVSNVYYNFTEGVTDIKPQ